MAPTAPSKPSARTLRHQRITGQIHPLLPAKIFRPTAQTNDSFLTSKSDKRIMKHSSFLSRVASSSSSSNKSKVLKRRRPSKKLNTNLDSLKDALPELKEGDDVAGRQKGKIRQRSLKQGRGALKRKERVVKGEMERFRASLARLTGEGGPVDPRPLQEQQESDTNNSGTSQGSNRWAVLRGHIASTMEQNPAFVKT